MYHLAGVVSFDTTQQMGRSRRAVEKFISNWNPAHPVEERLTLVRMAEITVSDEDDNGDPTGAIVPALDFEYTCPSQTTVEEINRQIYSDTVSNSFNDILGLSIWYTE